MYLFDYCNNAYVFLCLVNLTGSLLEIGEKQVAIEACEVAEISYLCLFQQRIVNNTFSLDDAAMFFHIPQTMMLQNICSFLTTNSTIVANVVVKWKCIYSEFRACLIQLGIGGHYIETFQAIQQMKVSDQDTLMEVSEQHKSKSNKFLEEKGQFVLTCLLKQSFEQVQSILRPEQIVLEYCIERESETEDVALNITGVLIVIQPDKKPLAFPIDFKKVLCLARKWGELLSNPQTIMDAKVTAQELCKLMFPSDVINLVGSCKVKNVFMCPDKSLNVLPLELLEFEDGETLGDKCTISYLSTSRELLRNLVVVSVSAAYDIVTKSEEANNQSKKMSEEPKDDDCRQEVSLKPKYGLVSLDYPSMKSEVIISQGQSKECIIVAAPNYDLQLKSESSFWGSVVQGFTSLFSEPAVDVRLAEPLPGAEIESMRIRQIFMNSANPVKVTDITKDDATLMAVLQIKSPFILHFSTHGFSHPYPRGCRSSFWDDTLSGLLLAGSNTYRRGNFSKIPPEVGTGELTSLAACGMDLRGTRLVYLSTCVSSYGLYSYGETINSLAQAFRSAGVQTVIASLWPLVDDIAQQFAAYFYEEAFKNGVLPSEALVYAKQRIREETKYEHWIYWSCFVCVGEDCPLFS